MGPPRIDGTSFVPLYDQGTDTGATITVQLGENSLSQVAKRLGMNPDDLLMANRQLKDPSSLRVGQELQVQKGYQMVEGQAAGTSMERGRQKRRTAR